MNPAKKKSCLKVALLMTILLGGFILFLFIPKSDLKECGGFRENATLHSKLTPYAVHDYGGRLYINLLFSDKSACALPYFQTIIGINPDHQETQLALSLAYAQNNDLLRSLWRLNLGLRNGIPAAQLKLAFAQVPEPSVSTSLIKFGLGLVDHGLVHGPMIGNLSADSVGIWIRTDGTAVVEGFAIQSDGEGQVQSSGKTITQADDDFTAHLQISGLEPHESYDYWLTLNGDAIKSKIWNFETPQSEGTPVEISIGFGGGADYIPPHEHMWTTLASNQLDAFFLLGDNVYIDDPNNKNAQRYHYYRRQFRPEYREFVSTTPIYAVWDDHDFATDNSFGGPETNNPPWKRQVWNVFKENWINPFYGRDDDHPGVWFKHAIGDVDFFFLDGRYYRTNAMEEPYNGSMLGDFQKGWLLTELRESDATLKFIVSPVPWAFEARNTPDAWNGYQNERNEIFDYIASNRIDGVILLSADRHRSDLWLIDRPDTYDLYEFESSKLTNQHTHPVMEDAIFSYNETPSFGLLRINTKLQDPKVTYRIITIDNETIFEYSVWLSEISSNQD